MSDLNPFYVYIHVNKINQKKYVGMSKRDNPNKRWKNGRGYTYNKHFNDAIKKYGWDNFEHLIFASDLTEQEASEIEKRLIDKFQTTDRTHGYNFAEGGYHNCGLKGSANPFWQKTPVKAVEASVAARIGKPLSEETKEKIRQGNLKKPKNENSLRALLEYDQSKIPRRSGAQNHKSRAVLCVETGIVYESQCIAEKALCLPRSSIYQALKQNIKAGNYHWALV